MSNVSSGVSLSFDRFQPDHVRRLSDAVEISFGGQLGDLNALLLMEKPAVDDLIDLLISQRQAWLAEDDSNDWPGTR